MKYNGKDNDTLVNDVISWLNICKWSLF
jgi:hypothetical protein